MYIYIYIYIYKDIVTQKIIHKDVIIQNLYYQNCDSFFLLIFESKYPNTLKLKNIPEIVLNIQITIFS